MPCNYVIDISNDVTEDDLALLQSSTRSNTGIMQITMLRRNNKKSTRVFRDFNVAKRALCNAKKHNLSKWNRVIEAPVVEAVIETPKHPELYKFEFEDFEDSHITQECLQLIDLSEPPSEERDQIIHALLDQAQ